MKASHWAPATAVCAAIAAVTSGATASPGAFSLTFTGAHVPDTSLPAGLRHEGRFTASGPACASGNAADVEDVVVEPLTVLRQFSCDDGSGTFTVLLPVARNEHGGSGTWQIVRGTGRYVDLRGAGKYTSVILTGSPDDFASITYRATWTGAADFDATAPVVEVAATAKRLRKPHTRYALRVSLAMPQEERGTKIAFSVTVTARQANLFSRSGTTTTGHAAFAARIRPPSGARRIRVTVVAKDPVGNASTTARSFPLPRSSG
jgi:hypothetical protein